MRLFQASTENLYSFVYNMEIKQPTCINYTEHNTFFPTTVAFQSLEWNRG